MKPLMIAIILLPLILSACAQPTPEIVYVKETVLVTVKPDESSKEKAPTDQPDVSTEAPTATTMETSTEFPEPTIYPTPTNVSETDVLGSKNFKMMPRIPNTVITTFEFHENDECGSTFMAVNSHYAITYKYDITIIDTEQIQQYFVDSLPGYGWILKSTGSSKLEFTPKSDDLKKYFTEISIWFRSNPAFVVEIESTGVLCVAEDWEQFFE